MTTVIFWDGFSNEMRGVFKPLRSYRILSPSCLTPNKSSRLHGFLRRDGESMPEPLSCQTAATAMAVWGASAEPLNGEPTKEVDGGCFCHDLLGVAWCRPPSQDSSGK